MDKQKELDAINSLLFCGLAYIEKYGHNLILDKDEIFHYTDLNGLKGILEGRGFWLSEAKFLNDEEELKNGMILTKELIKKLISEDKYSSFKKILFEISNKLEKYDYTNNYIASFSLKSDNLEQWRAYSNNGNGICIGLNIKKETIYPHFRWGQDLTLYKVIYDDDIKTSILQSIIFEYFCEYEKNMKNDIKYIDNDDYIELLTKSLVRVYINFKNKAFESEKEARLVYSTDNPLELFNKKHYRNVNNILVPYICTNDLKEKNKDGEKLEVDLLPITKIIVGPTVNKDVSTKSVENFVKDIGYSMDIVEPSKIPYRG